MAKQQVSKNWFTDIGTPPRDGNLIIPLVDGEEAWAKVYEEIKNARSYIHLCYWGFHLDFALLRPADKTFTDPFQRDPYTIEYLLLQKQREGVKIRILIWAAIDTEVSLPLLGIKPILTTIDGIKRLREHAKAGRFEVLFETHPDRIGSWHQKTMCIDGRIAFVGGMNMRDKVDWDTPEHKVYDYRRLKHKTTAAERKKMRDEKELPQGPRHDLIAYVSGPLVEDVEKNFNQRWNGGIKREIPFYDWATEVGTEVFGTGRPPTFGSGIKGQVVRTIPTTEWGMNERGILAAYIIAIRNAEKYIYIEDQYFRAQTIAEELAKACVRNPKLILIAATIPDGYKKINGKMISESSYWSKEAFQKIKRVRPDFRLNYFCSSAEDKDGEQIFVQYSLHAKIMIVDDLWYTIGSCNLNDRGFEFEGEINVTALDEKSAKVLRIKLMSEHMETECPDSIEEAAKLWKEHSIANDEALKKKTKPKSKVYSFEQTGPDRNWLGNPPDLFSLGD